MLNNRSRSYPSFARDTHPRSPHNASAVVCIKTNLSFLGPGLQYANWTALWEERRGAANPESSLEFNEAAVELSLLYERAFNSAVGHPCYSW
jgi:hypothetical protein